jgi:cyclophilin family peptidyl-prolyl cis-trans isomerase
MDAAPALDGFHVVFGEVLQGLEVLDAVAEIPTYTYKTQTGAVLFGAIVLYGRNTKDL